MLFQCEEESHSIVHLGKVRFVERNETPQAAGGKKKWYSIPEAAEYLDIGEQTLYRWMREGKVTFRKVGDSTRFWQEDLDSVMQVFYAAKDLEKSRETCPVCGHDELVEGKAQSTGFVYFVPKKTKFWTLKDSTIGTSSRMCARCGAISWFGDVAKLASLREKVAGEMPKDKKE